MEQTKRAVEVYQASEVCARCKGMCCKKYSGCYSPEDFGEVTYEKLRTDMKKGLLAIDWWEADPPEYFVRPRHVNEPVVCGSWGGVCVNLTEEGCRLSWNDRPLGCKALKPMENAQDYCRSDYLKEDSKNDWKQYDGILRRLVEEYRNGEL